MAIGTGEQAPEFDLEEEFGRPRVRLADFRGKRNVLLVFHPFAWTGVCEEEALDLQANLESFHNAETDVVFVSCDTSAARQAWRRKLGTTYTFASDFWQHGAAARAYGVFDETRGAPVRGTFLIDKDGVVIWALVRDIATRRTEMVPESLEALEAVDEPGAPRRVVGGRCRPPRGLSARGHRARRPRGELAERSARGLPVLAPDLIGHGSSPYEPPWDIDEHVDAILASVGRRARGMDRSFVRRPARIRDRCARARARREARAARSSDPCRSGDVALRCGDQPRGARLRLVRGRTGPPLRRERPAFRAERARRAGTARASRAVRRRALALPLLPVRRDRGVRRDGERPAAVRSWCRYRRCSCSVAARTCRTTISSTHIEPRSEPCSRSSSSTGGTPCSGMHSRRRPARSPVSSTPRR